jgi:hypothetical protein
MCIMASEPISEAYFINPSYQSVCMCIPPFIARQRLVKQVPGAMNKTTTETRVFGSLYPPIVAR